LLHRDLTMEEEPNEEMLDQAEKQLREEYTVIFDNLVLQEVALAVALSAFRGWAESQTTNHAPVKEALIREIVKLLRENSEELIRGILPPSEDPLPGRDAAAILSEEYAKSVDRAQAAMRDALMTTDPS